MAAPPADQLSHDSPARSIRRVILTRFGLVATVPLLTVALVYGAMLTHRTRAAAENALAQVAQSVGQRVGAHVLQHRQAIAALAGLIETDRDFTSPHVALGLAVTHTAYPGFITMVAADREGRLLAVSPVRPAAGSLYAPADLSIADRDYFQQPLTTGRPYLSQAFRGHGFGRDPVVALSAPIRDAGGTVTAVVEGSLDLTRLRQLCAADESADSLDIVVLDAGRHVVFSSNPARYPSLSVPTEPHFLRAPGPIGAAPSLGETTATAENPAAQLLAHLDVKVSADTATWSVVVLQDKSVAFADTRSYWRNAAFAAVIASLVAYGLSRRVATHLTAPLEALAASINQFSLGAAVSPRPPPVIGRIDETNRLWAGFFDMATRLDRTYAKLAQSQSELRYANTGLEAEVALRTSELAEELELRSAAEADIRRLALIAEHTSNIAVITDASGSIEWANPAFTRITGYTLAEAKGRKPGSFLQGPDSDPATIAHMRTCLLAGQGFRVQLLNYAKDGHTYWLEIATQPVTGPDGTITNYIAIETDITDRKKTEAELFSYRSRLELTLEAARTCTWDHDLAGNALHLDARWSHIFGGPARPTVLPGNQFLRNIHPADLSRAYRQVRRCLDGKSPDFRSEQRIRHATGEWVWVLSSGRVVSRDAAGRATRLIGTVTDITARKHAEAQLLRQKDFLATLQQTTLNLLARRELKDVFQSLIGHATALLRAPFGELLLREGEHLVICAHTHGDIFAGPSHLGRTDAPLSWRAHDSHQPVVLADYADSPDHRSYYENLTTHAVAIIPILLGEACVGVLSLGRTAPGDNFTEDDRAHCTLLAQMAALVLHNAGIRESALREAADRTVALRESEARARAAFDQSPVINILASLPEGILVEFNAVGLSTFGYTRDQVIGKTSPELGLWVDADERLRYLDVVRTQGSVRNFETRMRRSDGTIFPVICHGCTVTIAGQPYSLNTLEDITDRKRAEVALRESEERFRQVFDRSPVPIALAEYPSGRVISANDAVVAIWQRPRTEILGRTAIELGLWADLADRAQFYERMRRDGAVHNFETRFRHHDGSTATVLFSAALITIAGRPYSLNTLLDITERKASELARDASLALLRATLESTADGILVVNADGRFATYNGIFAGMWRLPANLAAADHDSIPDLIRRQLVEPDNLPVNLGELAPDSDGEVLANLTCEDGRIYECYSRPQLIGDEPSGRVWSFRDITARRRAEADRAKFEDQLRHAQKMESLGTLAGGIAHDFNNILTGILGFTDLTRLALPPGHSAHDYLDYILRSGQRARELVRQILTFSRSSSTDRVPHRLHHEISEALQLLRSTLPAMVELGRHLDPTTSPVLADATQVHQLVMNLCTNAWHALPPKGGRILVTLESHTVTPAEAAGHPDLLPGPYVRLSVSDTGSGMGAATLQHIFEPFFTTKEVGKGTGLGLAVVHGIMLAHQGAITVQSTLGVGTTFQLYFPAIVGPELPSTAPALDTIPRGQGQRLLFVDDDELSGFAIERLVANLGYKVLRITSPTRALQLFTAQPAEFALALVDLAMPEIAGDALAEQLLAVRPDLPVVMLTGYVEPDRQAAILASGVRDVLRKPPTLAELGQCLARHVAADPVAWRTPPGTVSPA